MSEEKGGFDGGQGGEGRSNRGLLPVVVSPVVRGQLLRKVASVTGFCVSLVVVFHILMQSNFIWSIAVEPLKSVILIALVAGVFVGGVASLCGTYALGDNLRKLQFEGRYEQAILEALDAESRIRRVGVFVFLVLSAVCLFCAWLTIGLLPVVCFLIAAK